MSTNSISYAHTGGVYIYAFNCINAFEM